MTESQTTELQTQFLEIVEQMKKQDCPLPDSFTLFYCVTTTESGDGQ